MADCLFVNGLVNLVVTALILRSATERILVGIKLKYGRTFWY